jgi:hypothetical protein
MFMCSSLFPSLNRRYRTIPLERAYKAASRPLLDPKFPDIRVINELFARNQRNVEETASAFEPLPRSAFNKGVTFEERRPNRGKIISLAHQLGALTREIARPL